MLRVVAITGGGVLFQWKCNETDSRGPPSRCAAHRRFASKARRNFKLADRQCEWTGVGYRVSPAAVSCTLVFAEVAIEDAVQAQPSARH